MSKPEPGKVYSLYDLAKHGSWEEAELRGKLPVGQVISYWDQANPYQEAVIVEPDGRFGQKAIFLDDGHTAFVYASAVRTDGKAGFQMVDRIMSQAEIQAALSLARNAREAREQKAEQDKQVQALEEKSLPAKYPFLEKTGKYSGRVLAARNIRTELKRAFPRVKFSVKSESYSMGNSVDIGWTDGPTTKQVEAITDKYESGTFDGMTDCYNYEHSPFKNVFGEAKHVQCARSFSDKLIARVLVLLSQEYGIKDIPTVEEYKSGNAYGSPMGNVNESNRTDYWCWQSLINRKAGETEGESG